LEWVARKRSVVKVFLAFPYNPYHPEPYSRFTETGMMDMPNDFLIGKEFWDFIGGEGIYEDLLGCFEHVGIELRSEIDAYFEKFKSGK
jgi:hypothetical protein